MMMWTRLIGAAVLAAATLALPAAGARAREGVAVIIGNADYHGALPNAPYAIRDALMMRRQVLTRLGYEPDQVDLVTDATRARLEEVLGSPAQPAAALAARVKPGETPLILFYSGHCVPGMEDARVYLLPVDGDPDEAAATALPLPELYRTLQALKPRNLFVILDCGLVGDSFGGPLLSAPMTALDDALIPPDGARTIVVAAGGSGQMANWDSGAGLGLLTRYLILGLDGAADTGRLGNADGKVTLAELQSWLTEEVGFTAKRRFGRIQHPLVIGPPSGVLAVAPGGKWPARETMDEARFAADRLVASPDDFDASPMLVPTAAPAAAAAVPASPPPVMAQPATAAPADPAPSPAPPTAEVAALVPVDPPSSGTGAAPAPVDDDLRLESVESESGPASVEEGLGLSRSQRIAVQEALSRIGYQLGVADGAFGPMTRKAISAWQQASRQTPTGYLTAEQAAMLSRAP